MGSLPTILQRTLIGYASLGSVTVRVRDIRMWRRNDFLLVGGHERLGLEKLGRSSERTTTVGS